LQRDAYEVVYAAEDHELPVRELRRQLGEPNRSNLRRAIRGLLKRGLMEESRSGEERCVKLTFWGVLFAEPPPPKAPPRASIPARLRALKREWEEEERQLELEEGVWIGYEHSFVRRRSLGPMQRRVLYVLWEYSDPLERGLPVTVVKAIVGGNRSNARRAIRTLLLRGLLDESEDGERVRLSPFAVFRYSSGGEWLIKPDEPIDDERAMEILRTQGEPALS
jgi:hypothetical protein